MLGGGGRERQRAERERDTKRGRQRAKRRQKARMSTHSLIEQTLTNGSAASWTSTTHCVPLHIMLCSSALEIYLLLME